MAVRQVLIIGENKYRSRWKQATDAEAQAILAELGVGGGGGTTDTGTIVVPPYTITATDVARKYFYLPTVPATETSVVISIGGAPGMVNGVDFAVETSSKRVLWNGLALDGVIAAGDIVTAIYKEL